VSSPLEGSRQTNQRAELTAALQALRKSNHNHPVEIRTDSKYTIHVATEWLPKWKANGWKTLVRVCRLFVSPVTFVSFGVLFMSY